jgi:hypothetical protein
VRESWVRARQRERGEGCGWVWRELGEGNKQLECGRSVASYTPHAGLAGPRACGVRAVRGRSGTSWPCARHHMLDAHDAARRVPQRQPAGRHDDAGSRQPQASCERAHAANFALSACLLRRVRRLSAAQLAPRKEHSTRLQAVLLAPVVCPPLPSWCAPPPRSSAARIHSSPSPDRARAPHNASPRNPCVRRARRVIAESRTHASTLLLSRLHPPHELQPEAASLVWRSGDPRPAAARIAAAARTARRRGSPAALPPISMPHAARQAAGGRRAAPP